eukprot:c27568_g1_i1 orf=281-2113(+)
MEVGRVVGAAVLMVFLPLLLSLSTQDDVPCLEQVKQSLSDPEGALSSWVFGNTTAGYVCDFVGVECWNLGENKVFSLKIPAAGFVGNFPTGLGLCTSLQQLDFSENGISGSIPVDICTELPYLTVLDFSSNNFTGSIPENLGNCSYLNRLHLQQNKLTGQIPWQIGVLSRLSDLDLSDNYLRGLIPSSFTNRSEINKAGFLASSFANNPELCGPPLTVSCGTSSSNTGMVVGVAVGIAIAVLVFGFSIWWAITRRKGGDRVKDEDKWAKGIKAPRFITVSLFEKPLVKMKLSDLMQATNDFGKDNIIATGRMGTVYKAILRDGSMLAIKRLPLPTQTDKQFKAEMNKLGRLRHRNLVPLLGYCVTGGERLLVYKHMLNGSLQKCLHGATEEEKLDWITRLKIAIGAARGLAWLHHSCNPRIIHRNISAASILLDEEYEPRITDVGLARLMNPANSHASAFGTVNFGDMGYVAPEYARTLVATARGDVFSFGVVLLELVTGQRAVEVPAEGDFRGSLAECIANLSKKGQLTEAIEKSLKDTCVDEELEEFLRIACACVVSDPKERLTMYEVFQQLRSIGQKYDFLDQYEDIVLADTGDMECSDELLVAIET